MQQKLPEGWKVWVQEDEEQSWLCLQGPRGQSVAFACERGSVRAEVLQDFLVLMVPNA